MAHTRWKKERKRNISSHEPFFKLNSSQFNRANYFKMTRGVVLYSFHRFLCCFSSDCYCALTKGNAATFSLSFHSVVLLKLLSVALCLVPYRSLYKEPWAATPFSSSLCWLRCMCVSLARVAIQKQKKQPAMSRAAARLELEEGTGTNTNCARIIIWISWVPARYAWLLQSANNMNYCFVAGSRRSRSRPGVCVVSCPHWMLLFVTLLFEFSPILNTFQFFSVLWFSSALSFFFF